ncbi:hypothetical protein [Streptomyces sp. YKOK-I1]
MFRAPGGVAEFRLSPGRRPGRNLIVRHPDGSVYEYVDRSAVG